MKIGLTADWHLHNFQEFSKPWREGLNTRFRDIFEVVGHELPNAMREKGVDAAVFAGDFNFNATNDYRVENATKDAIMKLYKLVRGRLVAVEGNHDTVVGYSGNSNGTLYVPRGCYEARQLEDWWVWPIGYHSTLPDLKRLPHSFRRWNILFVLHKDIQGGATSQGFVYRQEREVKLSYLLQLKEAIPKSVFFGGHLHSVQRIGLLQIIGAPVKHNRGDRMQTRGFMVFDTEKRDTQFYSLGGPVFVEIRWSKVGRRVLESGFDAPLYVTLYVGAGSLTQFREATEYLNDHKLIGVVKEISADSGTSEEEPDVIETVFSEEELLDRWIQKTEPELSAKVRTRLVRLGVGL